MTINYGKRNPGGLTAASPGDTLYIPFATYNDSGASIGIAGTLAVTDIEIFKNGDATPRATDSGYSLISDTGQYGNRVGLHRFRIQIFNTADDTGFFDVGSQYHVAIDAITVDGRTVRFFPAIFEIGTERANVVQIDGDTGPADNLGRIAGDTGTGSYIYRESDTGGIADAIWAKNSRTLTAFAFDTGIAQTVWRSSTSGFTSDTGSVGYAQGRLMAVRNDTGAAHLDQGRLGVISDTGRQAAVLDTGKVAAAVWASHQTRALTAFAFDTGVAQTVWRSSTSGFTTDTGSAGYAQGRLMAVKGDTGAAHLDGGRLGVSATATVDTGVIVNGVWNALRADHGDTGSFGELLRDSVSASVDTGAINNAVWNGNVSDHVVDTGSFGYAQGRLLAVRGDTGAAHLDAGRLGVSASAVVDTGVMVNAVWGALLTDHGDTGSFGELLRTPSASASIDTGQINQAVWQGDASRTLTAWAFDTGVQQAIARLDTGMSETIDAIKAQSDKLTFDTGANELHVDLRKVNNIQIQGAGDTGTGNTWRPA